MRVVAGRYRLLARLGSGGMGTVWRAEDAVLGREVAVKEVTFPPGLSDPDRDVLRERTRREARAAARLDHPSAVTVFDVVEQDGAAFLVMELVEARTLAEAVRADGPLSPPDAARVGLAVLGALRAAHARGIVHRDVKPGNVLLCTGYGAKGRVVLTDFGIATSAGDPSITSTGLLLGSPSYIAPERARGQQPGPPSDLWSLGATLFTAVEGRPPFDAGDPMSTVTAVVTGEHAPYVAAGPLEPVLAGLLERDPDARLDATAATRMLETVAATVGSPAAPPRPADADAGRRAEHTSALPLGQVQAAATGPAAQVLAPGLEPKVASGAGPASAADPSVDAGPADAGPADAGPADRGPVDPGPGDAGPADAGPADAGPGDRGPAGRGPVDPGPGDSRPVDLSSAAPARAPAPRPVRPAPGRRPRRPAWPLVLAALLALAAGVGGAALLAGGRGSTGGAAQPTAAAPPTPGQVPSPSGGGSASPSAAAAVPADWSSYSEPTEGWSLRYPPSWVRSDFSGQVQFRDPATRWTLRVDYSTTPKASALLAWQQASPAFARALNAYQQIRLEPVVFQGTDAADLEFTYTDGGADLHVLDRTFIAGGRGFALYWQVPTQDYAASLPRFEQLAATFRPNG